MKPLKYISIFIICSCLFSCDYATEKAKHKLESIANKTGSLIDEFLSLPDRSINRFIDDDELYGQWDLTPLSIQNIEEHLNNNPNYECLALAALQFTLYKDSSINFFVYNEYMPISYFDFPTELNDSNIVTGYWQIIRDTTYYNDSIENINNYLELNIQFNQNDSYIINFDITEENNKLILWTYIGDPDQLDYQEYVKL